MPPPQAVEKARCAIFSAETGFSCELRSRPEKPARKPCCARLPTPPRRASPIHCPEGAAGVGLKVRGLRPSDTSHGVYRQSEHRKMICALFMSKSLFSVSFYALR